MADFIRLEAVSKSFYGTAVLRDVDLNLQRGEVHSLVGENGAGKSTLMKVIAGAHKPSAGKIYVDGHFAHFSSPRDAYKSGIIMDP
jgi:ABC-type sugar transport system ATPase subunit